MLTLWLSPWLGTCNDTYPRILQALSHIGGRTRSWVARFAKINLYQLRPRTRTTFLNTFEIFYTVQNLWYWLSNIDLITIYTTTLQFYFRNFILFYFRNFILFYFGNFILFYFRHFILFYFTVFYFILLYFILFYFISFYFISFYFILFYFILFYFILFYFILF